MSHLLPEYRWVFLDGLFKALSTEDIGKKGVVDDKIKHFGLARFFVPSGVLLIDALFGFLQCCLPYFLELLSLEEPVLLDAHLRFGQIRIAFPLQLFSNLAQTPFEGVFFKIREIIWNQLSEQTRKFFKLFLIII
jgi:hypothetical protein